MQHSIRDCVCPQRQGQVGDRSKARVHCPREQSLFGGKVPPATDVATRFHYIRGRQRRNEGARGGLVKRAADFLRIAALNNRSVLLEATLKCQILDSGSGTDLFDQTDRSVSLYCLL